MVVGFLTMKWFDRTAQGFSPGKRPMANRPARATDGCVLSAKLIMIGTQRRCCEQIDSAALSGQLCLSASPRAKALGCFLQPFHG